MNFKAKFEQGREQLEEQQLTQYQQTVNELLDSSNPEGLKYGELLRGLQEHEINPETTGTEFLDTLIAQYPDFELAYLYRFELYNHLERHHDAKKDAERLVALDYTNVDYLTCLMASEENERNFKAVIDICNRVLSFAQDHVDFIFSRAAANLNLKNYDAAIADYQSYLNAQDIDEFDRQLSWLDQGRIFILKKDYPSAKHSFEQAKSYGLEPSQVESSLGLIIAKTEDHQQGLTQINEALEMNPECSYAYINRARLMIMKKDFEAATQDLEAARKYDMFNDFALEFELLTAEIESQ